MNIWGRLGISVAIVAMFSVLTTEVFQGKDFYQVYRWGICAGLLAMGAFLLVVGRFVNAKIRESPGVEGEEAPKGPFLLVNLEYWGLLLTIFGLIIIFIVPYKKVEARALAGRANAPAVKKVVTNAPTVNNVAATNQIPVAFLHGLKLQGVILNQGRASALINGRTYFVSDHVGAALLLAITPTNAILELNGQKRSLELSD